MVLPIIGLLTIEAEQPYLSYIQSLNLLELDPAIQLDTIPEGQFALVLKRGELSLAYTGHKQPGNISVDFTAGSTQHRRQFGGGKGQMIAKAVGIKGSYKPSVLDLTAGLGQDAFVLACLGCQLSLVERSTVVHALLHNGIQRGLHQTDDQSLRNILQKMDLHHDNGIHFLDALDELVDVIYLDPMFPTREKSAKVKKAMQAFHHIVGEDKDSGTLLAKALKKARYRVVVKRPRIAPALHEQYPELALPSPGLVMVGKSSRYDIYPLAKMPTV